MSIFSRDKILLLVFFILFSVLYGDKLQKFDIKQDSKIFLVPVYPGQLSAKSADKFQDKFRDEIRKDILFEYSLSHKVEKKVTKRILGHEVEQIKTWRYSDKFFNFLQKINIDYVIGGKISRSGGYFIFDARLISVQNREQLLEKSYFYDNFQQLYQKAGQNFLTDIHDLIQKRKNQYIGISILGGQLRGESRSKSILGGEISLNGSFGQIGAGVNTFKGGCPFQYYLDYRTPDLWGLYLLAGTGYFDFREGQFSLRYFKNIDNPNSVDYMKYLGGARAGIGYKINFGNWEIKPEVNYDGVYAKWEEMSQNKKGFIYSIMFRISIGYKFYY